jgi:hypothetical protein
MTTTVYNIVKAALGWSIYCDRVRLGGIYGSREAALEAVTVAAAFAVRDGAGVQINIPAPARLTGYHRSIGFLRLSKQLRPPLRTPPPARVMECPVINGDN